MSIRSNMDHCLFDETSGVNEYI